ncbi:MAG TPA: hypothetical protein VFS05_08005 [Gemmatimonadaceae bacterium]|nr:hypothetical protein [Gemmatimonadaceae bacterium]
MSLKMLGRITALSLLGGALACADGAGVTGPSGGLQPPPPQLEILDPPEWASGLERVTPLAQPITVSQQIGIRGGIISIPEAGLRVVVPPLAVRQPLTITATAVAGRLVAYEFQPHGTVFLLPLQVTQDLKGTTWRSDAGLPLMEVGYFADALQLDPLKGGALIDEFLPAVTDPVNGKLRFQIFHFSGYMVSSGRSR